METLVRLGNRFRPTEPAYSQELLDEFDGEDRGHLENSSSNRSRTDVPFLVLQGGFLFLLLFFLGYCILHGDIDRIIKGHDNCGNVCGNKNSFIIESKMVCEAEDMSSKPFLLINGFHRECVENCDSETIVLGHRCFYKADTAGQLSKDAEQDFESFVNEVGRDLHTCSREIISLCFIALGSAFFILLILRYMAGVFVWSVLIGVVLACVIATGYFWYLTDVSEGALPVAIVFSIVTLIIILIILVMRKRIQLVIQLFKEAGKSITAIPLLLFEPFLTFVALGILWSAWVYSMLWVESAGIPTETNGEVTYKQNAVIRFTCWYDLFFMLWMVQFVYGCQNMLIAGAISTWYFTRNKSKLGKPIYNSAYNMVKYHLGTVSLGSLIIALIQIIRILCRQVRKSFRLVKCCFYICCLHHYVENCLGYIEAWMKYFTRNAYVITCIHGYPFYESGTRAFKLLTENAVRVIAINSVGDFVLVLAKVLVVASTVIIGQLMIQDKEHVDNKWAPLVLAGLMAYLIAHCFLTVYEMAIDTIFICFCEDCEINDGLSRPYFMSHALMEFIEKSKSVLGIKAAQEVSAAHPVVVISQNAH